MELAPREERVARRDPAVLKPAAGSVRRARMLASSLVDGGATGSEEELGGAEGDAGDRGVREKVRGVERESGLVPHASNAPRFPPFVRHAPCLFRGLYH